MMVESITPKKVIKSKTYFKGRLFYAILPNQRSQTVTFYFSKANAEEARNVARALPLFIRDHYKLEPTFFCNSNTVAECMEGEWDYKKRTFSTIEEKNEQDKFGLLLDSATEVKESYLSQEHKQAMAMDGDDIISVNTRLTKGDAAPPPTTKDD